MTTISSKEEAAKPNKQPLRRYKRRDLLWREEDPRVLRRLGRQSVMNQKFANDKNQFRSPIAKTITNFNTDERTRTVDITLIGGALLPTELRRILSVL